MDLCGADFVPDDLAASASGSLIGYMTWTTYEVRLYSISHVNATFRRLRGSPIPVMRAVLLFAVIQNAEYRLIQ